MSSEPKLLTDEDIHALGQLNTHGERVAFLRERGLIAPEPVDPLLEEAGDMTTMHHNWDTAADFYAAKSLALAALKRGMELAPAASPLTRERLREAVIASRPQMFEDTDFKMGEGEPFRREVEGFVIRLHAAILKQMERPA